MENYSTAMDYATKSVEANGTAEQKYATYMESIDATVNEFIATWEQLVNNLNQSGTFKAIVELGTTILSLVDDFGLIKMAIIGAFGGAVIGTITKFRTSLMSTYGVMGNAVTTMTQYPTNINKIAMSMQGLLPKQQAMLLNTSKLTQATKTRVATMLNLGTVNGKVVTTTTKLTGAQRLQNLQAITLNKGYRDQIINAIGATEANGELTLSANANTKATIKQALASKGYSERVQEQVANALVASEANVTLANSMRGLRASFAAFMSTPMGWLTAAMVAIPIIIKLADAFTTTTDEAVEGFNELNNALQETESEIESLQSEIDSTNTKIDELLSKDTLTIVEQRELETLKETNKELERQLEIQEKLAERQEKEAIDAAEKVVGGQNWDFDNFLATGDFTASGLEIGERLLSGYRSAKQMYDSMMNTYTQNGTDMDLSDWEIEKLDEQKQKIQEASEALTTYTNDYSQYITELEKGDVAQQQMAKTLENLINEMLYADDATGYLNNITSNLTTAFTSGGSSIWSKDFQNALNTATEQLVNNKTLRSDIASALNLTEADIKLAADFDFGNPSKNTKEAQEAVEKIQENLRQAFISIPVKIEVDEGSVVTDVVSGLNTISSTVEDLNEAFDDLNNDGSVSVTTLSALDEQFSEIVPDYEKYRNVLMDASASADEQKKALEGILTQYVTQQGLLTGVTEENKAYVVQELEKIGVINAEEVANDALAQSLIEQEAEAKYLELTNGELNNSTLKNIESFYASETASDAAKDALGRLVLEQIKANSNQLSMEDSINQLYRFATAAGVAGGMLQTLYNLTFNPSAIKSTSGKSITDIKGGAEAVAKQREIVFRNNFEDIMNNLQDMLSTDVSEAVQTDIQLSGGGSGTDKSSGGGGSGDDPVVKAFEEAKAELDHLREMDLISTKEYYDRLKALVDKYYTGNEKYVDEYKEQAKTLYDLNNDIYEEQRENIDNQIEALQDEEGNTDEILNLIQQKRDSFTTQMQELSALGVSPETDTIKDLLSSLKDTDDEIVNALTDSLDEISEQNDTMQDYAKATNTFTQETELKLSKDLLDNIEANFEKYKDLYLLNEDAYKELLSAKADALENYLDNLQSMAEEEMDTIDRMTDELETLGQLTNEQSKKAAEQKMQILINAAQQGAYTEEEFADKRLDIEKEYLDALKNEYQAFIDDQVDAIQDQIDALEKQKEAQTEAYDEKIQQLQDELDAMDEAEEAENKLLEVEKARQNLAKAQSQKTAQIYHEGIGFVWESDPTEVKDAEDEYKSTLSDYNKWTKENEINDQIESLEEARDKAEEAIDDQIDDLKELQDEWSNSIDEIEGDADDYRDILDQFADDESLSFDERLNKVREFVQNMQDEISKVGDTYKQLNAELFGNRSKTWYVEANGQAPSDAKIGDNIVTTDGTYKIVNPNTEGAKYNPETGHWSIKTNDTNMSIADNDWGQEILSKSFDSNIKATDENTEAYNANSSAIQDNIEATNNNIDTTDNLSGVQEENTDRLGTNIDATGTNTSSTNRNTTAEDANTVALNRLEATMANWHFTMPIQTQPLSITGEVQMSEQDRATIESLQAQWQDAKASGASQEVLDAIHDAAESIRDAYGYSGGVDGSEYIKKDTSSYTVSGMRVETGKGYAYYDKGGVMHVVSNKEDAEKYSADGNYVETDAEHSGGYLVTTDEKGNKDTVIGYKDANGNVTSITGGNRTDRLNDKKLDEGIKGLDDALTNNKNGIQDNSAALDANTTGTLDAAAQNAQTGADVVAGVQTAISNMPIGTALVGVSPVSGGGTTAPPSGDGGDDEPPSGGMSERVYSYTWSDGTTTTSKSNNYHEAAKEAGKEGANLVSSTSYTKGSSKKDKEQDKNTQSNKENSNATNINTSATNNLSDNVNGNSDVTERNSQALDNNAESNAKSTDRIETSNKATAESVADSAKDISNAVSRARSSGGSDGSGIVINNLRDKYGKDAADAWSSRHASGVISSNAERAIVDEKGEELIVRPPTNGRMTYLEKGTGVIPADVTKTLWRLGTNPHQFFTDEFNRNMNKVGGYNYSRDINNTVTIGDIRLENVKDADGLSQAIVNKLPTQIIKDMFSRS